jgi:hypothetical protein
MYPKLVVSYIICLEIRQTLEVPIPIKNLPQKNRLALIKLVLTLGQTAQLSFTCQQKRSLAPNHLTQIHQGIQNLQHVGAAVNQ